MLRGHAGVVADHLGRAVGGAGERDAVLAVGVGETRHGGGGDKDGESDGVGEDGGGCRAVRAVDEDAGAEEDAAVGGVVEGFGDEVVGGGVVIAPGFGGNKSSSGGFYVIEIEETV